MKLNMDVVREILFALEEREELGLVLVSRLEISDDFSLDQLKYHAQLLLEAGYIVGEPWLIEGVHLHDFHIERLTWKGHEFVANARNPEAWNATIEQAKKAGGTLGLSVFSEVLGAFTRSLLNLP